MKTKHFHKRFSVTLALTAILIPPFCFTTPSPLFAEGDYSIIALGTLGGTNSRPTAINKAGQVIGISSTTDDAAEHAFLWKNGVMTDLGTLGGTSSYPVAINEAGEIAGISPVNQMAHGFRWKHEVLTDLGTLGDNWFTVPTAINNAGQIIGYSYTQKINMHSFMWQNGAMTDLGTLGGT